MASAKNIDEVATTEPVIEESVAHDLAVPTLEKGELISDVALDTVEAEHEYTDEDFRKLRWKIDLWLLPLMWVSTEQFLISKRQFGITFEISMLTYYNSVLLWNSAGRQNCY
jgi:hypothetical protein